MPPLDTSAGKVGQCPTHLPRIVVVVIHMNNRSCTVESEASPSPYHVRMALVGPCRPLSSLISVSTLPNSRLTTGMYWTWSKRPSSSPRVFLLSALFVAAVQSCRRRCAVRRCSNRRIAIRNHASNQRWRRVVQTSNGPTTRDWRCCRPTQRRTRVCRADRRTM